MENENDLKKPEATKSEDQKDPGANIETVTPSTEELIPETPVNGDKEESEDNSKPSPTPANDSSAPTDDKKTDEKVDKNDPGNDIETVAP